MGSFIQVIRASLLFSLGFCSTSGLPVMFHGEFKPSGQIFSGCSKEKGRKELMAYALSRCSQGNSPGKPEPVWFSLPVLSSNLPKKTSGVALAWKQIPAAPGVSIHTQGFLCSVYIDSVNEQPAHVHTGAIAVQTKGLSFLFLQLRRLSAPRICTSVSTATARCDSRGWQLQGG